MSKNKKKTSTSMGSFASSILKDTQSSEIAKKLAASALAQTSTDKQTGAELEELASKVLKSSKYNDDTKSLAATVLSQSNKER